MTEMHLLAAVLAIVAASVEAMVYVLEDGPPRLWRLIASVGFLLMAIVILAQYFVS